MEMRWRLQAASFEHWYFRTCELATTHCQRLSYKLRSRKKSNEACTLGISVDLESFFEFKKGGFNCTLFVLWHQLGIVYTKKGCQIWVRFGNHFERLSNWIHPFFGCLRFLYDIMIIYICGKCHRYILETKGFVWKRQRWSLLGSCGFWIVYSGFRTLGSRVLGFGFWIWRFGHLLIVLLKRQPCRKVG